MKGHVPDGEPPGLGPHIFSSVKRKTGRMILRGKEVGRERIKEQQLSTSPVQELAAASHSRWVKEKKEDSDSLRTHHLVWSQGGI